MKCAVARNEFQFTAGRLDILAYNRINRCFHYAKAIGPLIAYISMIQEGSYELLKLISMEERLELSDFAAFMENRAIDICFYVALLFEKQDMLVTPYTRVFDLYRRYFLAVLF